MWSSREVSCRTQEESVSGSEMLVDKGPRTLGKQEGKWLDWQEIYLGDTGR
jgi:hypothetical protein